MRSRRRLGIALLLLVLLGGSLVPAQASEAPVKGAAKTPGLEAAQAISTITGVAISPLLGVGAIGAYQWWKTPPEKRARLAWFAQPWFWIPALALVGLALIKDTFGTALPSAAKKPFDIAETIENKISGLIVAGAFVPLIAAIFHSTGQDGTWLQETGLAMVDLRPLLNVLTVPVAIAAFAVVWLVSHVIHVLILISPFTTVDAALKGMRLAVLSTIPLTSYINPYLGAAWALLIVVICWFLAGWAFRLFVFGTLFTWDLGTFRRMRFKVHPEANWVFTGQPLGQTPIRTYGRLSRDATGQWQIVYRPWLVLPQRTETLPPGNYAVGRGLFYSEIVRLENEEAAPVATLAPCYRTHEEELSTCYQLGAVQEIGVLKGMKSVWNQIRALGPVRQ